MAKKELKEKGKEEAQRALVKYKPENDYLSRNFEPFYEPPVDMCGKCKNYYSDIHARGLTQSPFPPKCDGSILDGTDLITVDDFDTEEEYDIYMTATDPVSWALRYLNWEARWYQEQVMTCTSRRIICRWGRRTGKTIALVVKILWMLNTNNNYSILVVAPYEAQVRKIFDEIDKFVQAAPEIQGAVKRSTKSPCRIEFMNGSRALGFSSGSKSAARSDKIRGQDAHYIALDEMDYLDEDDVDAILAILASHPDCGLWASSTPTGMHRKFYQFSVQKDLGFKEYWYISPEAPNWTPEVEKFLKESTVSTQYEHEYMAIFGIQESGVFRNDLVDAALRDYKLPELRTQGSAVCIGVDWNGQSIGTHIVVTECVRDQEGNIKYVPLETKVVKGTEFTQHDTVEEIIRLNEVYNPLFIYVDAGYGECVHPDTLISTEEGVKTISNIKIGDKVLDSRGEWSSVLGKVIRDDPKPTYNISIRKCLPVTTSDTHPFLTPNGYTKVRDLSIGDLVALPTLGRSHNRQDCIIDLSKYSSGYNDVYVWANSHSGKNGTTKINRYINILSEEFLSLAGWYLSEGSAYKYTVEIAQNPGPELEEIKKLLESVTGVKPKEDIKSDGTARAWINSRVLVDFFKDILGHGCEGKFIPKKLMHTWKALGPLINSVFRGDGSRFQNTSCGWSLSLANPSLVDQIRLILNSIGVVPNSYIEKKRKDHHKTKYRIDISGSSNVIAKFDKFTGLHTSNPERISRSNVTWIDKTPYCKISKIEQTEDFIGLVDIEVEGGHSFCGNGLLLHNTQVEMLHKYGQQNSGTGLHSKVVPYSMGGSIEITDPITKQPIKKNAKPFLVNIAVLQLEQNRVVLPISEDTQILVETTENKDSGKGKGIVQQMRNFAIERVSITGLPTYSQGEDHGLTAWMLSVAAFVIELSDMKGHFRIQVPQATRSLQMPPDTHGDSVSQLGEQMANAARNVGLNGGAKLDPRDAYREYAKERNRIARGDPNTISKYFGRGNVDRTSGMKPQGWGSRRGGGRSSF